MVECLDKLQEKVEALKDMHNETTNILERIVPTALRKAFSGKLKDGGQLVSGEV